MEDGGAKITHYVVERKETGKPYWTTVSSFGKVFELRSQSSQTPHSSMVCSQDCNFDVQGLIENKEYTFRVAACNENGQGEWIEADSPIVAKLPFGKFKFASQIRANSLPLQMLLELLVNLMSQKLVEIL